jgi:hypothetical protein
MGNTHFRVPAGMARGSLVLGIALACATPAIWSESRAQTPPSVIEFDVVSAGAKRAHNACFHVSATIGQAAPGYSSNSSYSLLAGFMVAGRRPPPLDEIFFNGFEAC